MWLWKPYTSSFISGSAIPSILLSVTRLGDISDFGQVFKAFGNN